MTQKMKIRNYEVWVSLGCSGEEQSLTQPVHFNLTIDFNHAVKGCVTDHIQDAIDYFALTEIIKNVSQEKSFHLIEHLCFMVHQHIDTFLKKCKVNGRFTTEAIKLRPPVQSLQNGVEFSCSSELSY